LELTLNTPLQQESWH